MSRLVWDEKSIIKRFIFWGKTRIFVNNRENSRLFLYTKRGIFILSTMNHRSWSFLLKLGHPTRFVSKKLFPPPDNKFFLEKKNRKNLGHTWSFYKSLHEPKNLSQILHFFIWKRGCIMKNGQVGKCTVR